MKMKILLGLGAAVILCLGGFLYYVGSTNASGPRDIYIQNKADITPTVWREVIDKINGEAVYTVNELVDERTEYPRVVVEAQADGYTLAFTYRNDGDEDPALETAVVTALRLYVDTPVSVNVTAKRSYVSDETERVRNMSLVIMWISYILIVICGASITQSVSSEKINRIIDVLVYKVSPSTMIFSKICALLTIISQLFFVLILEVLLFQAVGVIQANFLSRLLLDLNIGFNEGVLIVLFSFLGCFVYTLLFAIPGIFVTSQEQQQFAPFPVTITIFSAFAFTYIALALMDRTLLQYSTYVPLTAPLTMPAVLILGGYQYTDIIIPLLIIIGFLVAVIVVINKVILPRKIN
jgi:ABC-type Na+ efflux pump permease subunit